MIKAYSVMRPRVEAQRTLQMVTAFKLASGKMKPRQAKKLIARLEKEAYGQSSSGRKIKKLGDWPMMRIHDERKAATN